MPQKQQPKIDKVEKLAAELARAAMAHGAYAAKTPEDLAGYCLTVAKVISEHNEQDDQG